MRTRVGVVAHGLIFRGAIVEFYNCLSLYLRYEQSFEDTSNIPISNLDCKVPLLLFRP